MPFTLQNVGGALTGGADVALTIAGNTGGKVTLLTPSSTRLKPQTLEMLTSMSKSSASDPGVARAQARINFADRQVEDGCCSPHVGLVGFDVNFRWHLNQPVRLVDDALEYLQALVFSPAFKSMLINGTLPSN